MTIFAPKKGPIATIGRLKHIGVGVGVTALAGFGSLIFGGSFYDGATGGAVLSSLIGGAWETLTPVVAKETKWRHPWGDAIDFLAFQLGAVLVAMPAALIGAS